MIAPIKDFLFYLSFVFISALLQIYGYQSRRVNFPITETEEIDFLIISTKIHFEN